MPFDDLLAKISIQKLRKQCFRGHRDCSAVARIPTQTFSLAVCTSFSALILTLASNRKKKLQRQTDAIEMSSI